MIKIAAAIRHWTRKDWHCKYPSHTVVVGMAVAELWYDPEMVQFRVKYREWTDHTREQWIPKQYTKAWMNHFARDQSTLQPDSYYVSWIKDDAWETILEKLV